MWCSSLIKRFIKVERDDVCTGFVSKDTVDGVEMVGVGCYRIKERRKEKYLRCSR